MIKTLELFDVAITQNAAVSHDENVSNWLGDHEIGGSAVAAAAGTGVTVVTVLGSYDGVNFNAIGTLLAGVASDGAADFGTLDLAAPYPFLRFTATENNTGAVTNFILHVSINSTGGD